MRTLVLLLPMLLAQPGLLREARQAMARQDYAAARSAIDRALASGAAGGEDEAAARFLSGFLYHIENELPRAIPELERAAKLAPRDPRPPLYLALTLESLNRAGEADASYRRAVSLADVAAKADPEVHLAYARYLMVMGELDRAGALIARATRIAPNSRDAHFENARLLLRRNEPGAAAASAERALACQPGGIAEEQVRYVLSRARRLAAAASAPK